MGGYIMASTINADTTNGVVVTSDTSGEIELQSAGVTKAKVTANGLQDANGNSLRGGMYRNLLINGNMQIAQRGTTSTSNGYQTVDRWSINTSGVSATKDQVALTSSDTPYLSGLRFACKLTNTSTSTATNSYAEYRYRIEAQNMAQSGWNYTNSSSSVTLSFWIKSSVTGQYYGYVKTDDGTNKRYNFPFDLVADTWKKVIVTISGHSDLQFDNDNGTGLQLYVYAYLGTNYADSGALTETWETYDSSSITPDFTSNWNNTASATMFLTGVQLEVGEGASDFEFLPYDVQLARCQRYLVYNETTIGNRYVSGLDAGNTINAYGPITLPTTMRATPTISRNNLVLRRGATNYTISSITPQTYFTNTSICGLTVVASGLSTNNQYQIRANATDSYLKFEAEL